MLEVRSLNKVDLCVAHKQLMVYDMNRRKIVAQKKGGCCLMLMYIDYLDHVTSGHRSFSALERRLRFDLLIFGHDTLCMSVPACIKMQDTTNLLMKLDDFWKAGTIQLQLDAKHRGNPNNYFNNRKRVLAHGMPEEKLVEHFEFIAYESARTPKFFSTYLSENLSLDSSNIYIGKKHDTDALFRSDSVELFQNHCEPVCGLLELNRAIAFTGMVNRIGDYAMDNSMLFQRAVVEERIVEEFNPQGVEGQVVATLLDRAFALANAETSEAIPISLVLNQLTGAWLQRMLYYSYGELYNLICGLSWKDVYDLSQYSDWRYFVEYINVFIALVQDAATKKYSIGIEKAISKLNCSVSLLKLIKFARQKAIDALKDKLYKAGLFTEAQNVEKTLDMAVDCYNGEYRKLMDALKCIDVLASHVKDYLTIIKPSQYLLPDSRNKEVMFEVFK